MTRTKHVFAAAALALGACGIAASPAWAQNQSSDQQQKEQQKQQNQQEAQQAAAGSKQKGATTQPTAFLLVVPVPVERVAPAIVPAGTVLAPDGEAIRDTLASATEAAVAEEGFDDLLERFVDADRNRLGRFDADDSRLEAARERFEDAWQAKYNSELDIEEEGDIYGSFPIVQGVITAPMEPARKTMPANTPGDYNLDPGREVAVVTLPAAHDLPETTLVMINEAFGWKIDVPNTRTGAEIHSSLIECLNKMTDNVAKWPARPEAAKRFLTHQVMLAAVGKQQTQEAQTAGSKQQN